MTNEEAIKVIENRFSIMDYCESEKLGEALDMAIAALKAKPCEDVISRRAMLDGLASIAKVKAKSDAQKSLMGRVMFFTEQLPPVTPKPIECEYAVSREAVLQGMYDLCNTGETLKENPWRDNPHIDAIIDTIENLPPVTPKPMWIPVSERLPEKSGMYIVTDKVFSLVDSEHTGRFKRMTEQVEFCNGKWQRATRFYEIVAWMPLPEPYKEGESE